MKIEPVRREGYLMHCKSHKADSILIVQQYRYALVLQKKHSFLYCFAILVQQITVLFVDGLLRQTVKQNLRRLVALETLQNE
mgnify:CR=1 FL=1